MLQARSYSHASSRAAALCPGKGCSALSQAVSLEGLPRPCWAMRSHGCWAFACKGILWHAHTGVQGMHCSWQLPPLCGRGSSKIPNPDERSAAQVLNGRTASPCPDAGLPRPVGSCGGAEAQCAAERRAGAERGGEAAVVLFGGRRGGWLRPGGRSRVALQRSAPLPRLVCGSHLYSTAVPAPPRIISVCLPCPAGRPNARCLHCCPHVCRWLPARQRR